MNFSITATAPEGTGYRPLVEVERWRYLVPERAVVDVAVTGHRCLSRVVLELELVDERGYHESRIDITAAPGGPRIDFLDLRVSVRAGWEQAGIAHLARLEAADGTVYTPDAPIDDPLMSVALTYSTAAAVGAPPVQFVAERLGITAGAASQRVKRARDAGYLPPTTPGVVS